MPSFTLADIQAAADKKYGPVTITLEGDDVVTLTNPLRLSKANRDKLQALDDEDDVEIKLTGVIKAVASQADAKRLLAAVGGDLATLAQIVTDWQEATQVGEASPSPS